ncbi:DUF975 family protein [Clostridium sp. YIM B02551]|uniref:DUF975 family protein n=1 Tax=Clostridium sp. YIM B02551 TaxID=2910679 RepID=UPI001EEC1A6F|nr:DUF975 family protein [Clostridium sp. YIM B02551]
MENSKKISIRYLKKNALKSLKGKWGLAIGSTVLGGIIMSLPSFIVSAFTTNSLLKMANEFEQRGYNYNYNYNYDFNYDFSRMFQVQASNTGLIMILSLLVAGAIRFGLTRFNLNLIRDTKPRVEDIFSGFKKYLKTFLINLLLYIFRFLWGLLLALPIIVFVIIFVISVIKNDDVSVAAVVLLYLGILASVIVLQIFLSRYAMAFYIFNDNDEIDVMDSLNMSIELMVGKKIKFFLMQLSFIGWGILAVLSCGIGFLWLIPYMKATEACFYQEITGYQENVEVIEL